MDYELVNEFCWWESAEPRGETLSDAEKYQRVVRWSMDARGRNPNAFDKVTEWLLDDSVWSGEQLSENEQILMQGLLGRFREQNARLREYLCALPAGLVNPAVFPALDRFDGELSGKTRNSRLQNIVSALFSDFSLMKDRSFRRQIAGGRTGPTGTDTVDFYGYINTLKDCDAAVQWTLFMPGTVENMQNGFKMESFAYRKMPAMRFIGRDENGLSPAEREKLFRTLDAMDGYRSGFDYDVLLMHHYGLGVDVGPWHGFWGRFMKADTPVPEGFLSFDFEPYHDGKAGPPFLSQFAYALFSGDRETLHRREGYDSDAMYDTVRNTILGQGGNIPYPDKYWTAEVMLGEDSPYSGAYMFSTAL